MRTLLVTALVAVPVLALAAPPASANCDPKYEPLCVNDCQTAPPDVRDPLEWLGRTCPE